MTCHEEQNLVTGTMPKIAEFVKNHEIWEHCPPRYAIHLLVWRVGDCCCCCGVVPVGRIVVVAGAQFLIVGQRKINTLAAISDQLLLAIVCISIL